MLSINFGMYLVPNGASRLAKEGKTEGNVVPTAPLIGQFHHPIGTERQILPPTPPAFHHSSSAIMSATRSEHIS
jgi:hypothetical protein